MAIDDYRKSTRSFQAMHIWMRMDLSMTLAMTLIEDDSSRECKWGLARSCSGTRTWCKIGVE